MTDTLIEQLIYQAIDEATDIELEGFNLHYLGDRRIQDSSMAIVIFEMNPNNATANTDGVVYNPVYGIEMHITETLDYIGAQKRLSTLADVILRILHTSPVFEDDKFDMTVKNNLPIYEESDYILKSRRVEVSFKKRVNYYGSNDEINEISMSGELQ